MIRRNSSRETIARSTSGSSEAISSITESGSACIASTNGWMYASIASRPSSAAPNSLMFSSARPAKKSNSSASDGAGVTSAPIRVTRSPSSAPQASAWGAPPEPPTTAKHSKPSSSAIAWMSPAASATERPGCGSEPP